MFPRHLRIPPLEVRCLNIFWCNIQVCWKYRRCRHQEKKNTQFWKFTTRYSTISNVPMGSCTEKILTTLMGRRKDRSRFSRVGGSGEPNYNVRLYPRLYSVASHFAIWFWCPTSQKSPNRFWRSRCTQKIIIFPDGAFSLRLLPLERMSSNTRGTISKRGVVHYTWRHFLTRLFPRTPFNVTT